MSDVVEFDAITGITVLRDFTTEEAEQRAAELRDISSAEKAQAKADADAATAREAAIAHAKSLGFTDAMIAVMYPGLVA